MFVFFVVVPSCDSESRAHAHGLTPRGLGLRCLHARERPFCAALRLVRGARAGALALRCLQLPTTLPTLDELMGQDGEAGADPVAWLLRQTAVPSGDHVYTLHAELEGRRLAPWFDRLLAGWRAQGYDFVSLGDMAAGLDASQLPERAVRAGTVPGRSGTLAVDVQI